MLMAARANEAHYLSLLHTVRRFPWTRHTLVTSNMEVPTWNFQAWLRLSEMPFKPLRIQSNLEPPSWKTTFRQILSHWSYQSSLTAWTLTHWMARSDRSFSQTFPVFMLTAWAGPVGERSITCVLSNWCSREFSFIESSLSLENAEIWTR